MLGPAIAALICALALLSSQVRLQAQSVPTASAPPSSIPSDDPDRPILTHRSQAADAGRRNEDAAGTSFQMPVQSRGPTVAPGVTLPATGRIWALDTFEGMQELVHMMYIPIITDRHAAENLVKANLAPFIYKPKMTMEIPGTKAAVRLHDLTPVIFVRRSRADVEDAALGSASAQGNTGLALVKLEVHGNKRLVSTIAYTQVTGKASRSQAAVETVIEPVAKSDWEKIMPKHPLAPGEYALVALPEQQNLYSTRVFDFAIDPKAPRNSVVAPRDDQPVSNINK
jgi:hypothetical protein